MHGEKQGISGNRVLVIENGNVLKHNDKDNKKPEQSWHTRFWLTGRAAYVDDGTNDKKNIKNAVVIRVILLPAATIGVPSA